MLRKEINNRIPKKKLCVDQIILGKKCSNGNNTRRQGREQEEKIIKRKGNKKQALSK